MNSDRRSPIRSARSFLEFNYTAADRAARSLPVERSARRSINVRVRGSRRNNRAGRKNERGEEERRNGAGGGSARARRFLRGKQRACPGNPRHPSVDMKGIPGRLSKFPR